MLPTVKEAYYHTIKSAYGAAFATTNIAAHFTAFYSAYGTT